MQGWMSTKRCAQLRSKTRTARRFCRRFYQQPQGNRGVHQGDQGRVRGKRPRDRSLRGGWKLLVRAARRAGGLRDRHKGGTPGKDKGRGAGKARATRSTLPCCARQGKQDPSAHSAPSRLRIGPERPAGRAAAKRFWGLRPPRPGPRMGWPLEGGRRRRVGPPPFLGAPAASTARPNATAADRSTAAFLGAPAAPARGRHSR